ncbi:hypothetical protein [Nannocystis sp. SCPEA4]|uniref:hypothetical protein n=1 Tax=Nannocystis sp. SCPEA4 TaxID=2996787 RepID=UPI00226FD7CB|nr:hypothetical protein [Nannocystis sp. SCPEA4]MCY1058077.1 hypothetical protein [Nannocystis sp. SCPEA4]
MILSINPMFRSMDGRPCEQASAVFDLLIMREGDPAPAALATQPRPQKDSQSRVDLELPRLVRLVLGLSNVKALARELHRAGGRALIIPSCYAAHRISIEKARLLAEKERIRLNSQREIPLGDLMDGVEDAIGWIFAAEDPKQAEREPGCLFIHIDSIDGHVQTLNERKAFSDLQSERE